MCFHVGLACVARIHEAVAALCVQLIQHRHGAELGTTQRRELVVLLTRHHQERVTPVHQVIVHQRVRITDHRQCGIAGLQTDHKEHLNTTPTIHTIISPIKTKGSPYLITEHRVPELIPVLGSQPAGDMSHKPGGRLPLLSARPAVILAILKSAATTFSAW